MLEGKFLPENTPIAMLWLVKDPTKVRSDRLPLPDNERHPYKARLLNWAESLFTIFLTIEQRKLKQPFAG